MTVDTIIVGAGSAGCVLAARLSEEPSCSVVLLEAGPDYPSEAELPAEVRKGFTATPTHDWGYVSEPGLGIPPIAQLRAKLVGGCSATNATFALRGSPADYDDWAAQGNPGWSFSEVLPFFRKLESDADFDNEWHGQDGPLPIRRYSHESLVPGQAEFLQVLLHGRVVRAEEDSPIGLDREHPIRRGQVQPIDHVLRQRGPDGAAHLAQCYLANHVSPWRGTSRRETTVA